MKRVLVAVLLLAAVEASASCIHGTLLAPDGKPVAGAKVSLYTGQAVVNQGKTDARGFFRVDPKRRGDFEVRIEAEGYAPLVMQAKAGANLGTIRMENDSPQRHRESH